MKKTQSKKKKTNKKDQFQMQGTIKQKQRAYIQSMIVVGVISALITFFVTNFIVTFSNEGIEVNRIEAWLKSRPLTETIFAPIDGMSVTITFIFVLMFAYFAIRGFSRISHDITTESGTAQWNTVKALNEQFSKSENPKEPDHPTDMILSKHVRVSTDIYYHGTAVNMVILGATRSGKSRFFVKPNILQMNCNYVVTDPKGELLEAVGPVLQAFGYNVRVFDIFDKEKCNTYNPFRYISTEEEVATLAQQLMDAAKPGGDEGGGGGGESPFWDLSSLSLLRACIYLLKWYGDDPEVMGGKTYIPCFSSVNLLLALAMEREGKAGQNATLEGSYLDEMFERAKAKSPNSLPYCCLAWDQIKGNTLNPTGATIIANTTARLNMFAIDRIRDLTSSDNIDLDSFGEQKDAIFLIMNPKDKTFNFLLNMLYSQLFNSMYKRGKHFEGCKYAHMPDGELLRFWRPEEKESKEAFEARVEADIQAMCKPTVRPRAHYLEIVDANGKKISARPDKELASNFVKELSHLKVVDMHGTMFPFHNRFILDEFFNIGKIPDFLTVLSTIAGYNSSCDVILQDINQIKSMYDKDWGSVFGNCPINLVLKVADNETAKYVSESLGKMTISHAQEQHSKTDLKSNSEIRIDVKQRDLMTMDEVKTMDNGKELIIISGNYPLMDDKHPYTTHPLYKYTSDATHIPFDRNRLIIRPIELTKEVESMSAGPNIEFLTTERIFRLFSAQDDYYDDGYEDDDDAYGFGNF